MADSEKDNAGQDLAMIDKIIIQLFTDNVHIAYWDALGKLNDHALKSSHLNRISEMLSKLSLSVCFQIQVSLLFLK